MNVNIKNNSIQSLKGIAAVVVFLSHALHFYKSNLISILDDSFLRFLYNGQHAVIFFFVISGFFYYKTEFNFKSYLYGIVKKIFKIYPPYIITLLLAYYLCNLNISYNKSMFTEWSNSFWNYPVSFSDLLKQLTLIIPTNTHILNPPIWYLYVEVKMFFIMPLLIGLWNLKGCIYLLPIFILTLFYPFLPLSLGFCSILLLGSITKYISNINEITNYIIKYKYVFILIGLFLLNISFFVLPPNNEYHWRLQALGSAIILLTIYKCNFLFFNSKILIFLGNISYEFYLLHFIILLFLRQYSITPIIFIFLSFILSVIGGYLLNLISLIIQNKVYNYNITHTHV